MASAVMENKERKKKEAQHQISGTGTVTQASPLGVRQTAWAMRGTLFSNNHISKSIQEFSKNVTVLERSRRELSKTVACFERSRIIIEIWSLEKHVPRREQTQFAAPPLSVDIAGTGCTTGS